MPDIETVAIDSLIPHPANPRQGDVGAISESLRVHGQYKPIVVQQSTRHVLAGNHTVQAARTLGWDSIDVVFRDVDDDEALRIMLVDNRTNDLASYDDTFYAEVIRDNIASSVRGYEGTALDGDFLDELLQHITSPGLFDPPVEFPDAEALASNTEHRCPSCGYVWSGAAQTRPE